MDKVTQLYNTIETEYKVFNYFPNFPDTEDLSEQEKLQLGYEYIAMNNFDADIFKERIRKEKELICKYLLPRITNSNKPHLLARYYHLLLICSENNQHITIQSSTTKRLLIIFYFTLRRNIIMFILQKF